MVGCVIILIYLFLDASASATIIINYYLLINNEHIFYATSYCMCTSNGSKPYALIYLVVIMRRAQIHYHH